MSDPSAPLINIGDLAQPVTTLIEKVSDCVGILYEPARIVKKAKAEVEADRIKALARLEIGDLERRTLNRMLSEGTREQERMESILSKALPDIRSDAKPEALNEDWVTAFFGHARHVSDEEMQNLWARVLSDETNNPKSYSRRTLNFLSNMEKADAELLTRLCSFMVLWDGVNIPLVFDFAGQIYVKRLITFSTLSHLDSIGLVRFAAVGNLSMTGGPPKGEVLEVSYFNEKLHFFLSPAMRPLPMGKVEFTRSGAELSRIAGAEKEDEFLPTLIEKWREVGVRWCSPLGRVVTITAPTARSLVAGTWE